MPVKKIISPKRGKPMASLSARSSRKLKPLAKMAKIAKPARMPRSVGAAAVATPARKKPREQLGAVDRVLVDLLSNLYRDLNALVESFKRRLKALSILKRGRT